MSFAARYFGRCGECGEAIIPGMEIDYVDDIAVHYSCVRPEHIEKDDLICTRCNLVVPWVVDGVCQDCV